MMAATLLATALFAMSACANNGAASQEERPTGSEAASQEEQPVVQRDMVLPAANEVSVSEQPMMYDFVNGCAGFHTDMVSMIDNEWDYIIVTKDGSTKIYAAFLQAAEGDYNINLFLPRFSSDPREYTFKDEGEQQDFYATLNGDVEGGKARKYVENGVDFYVIPWDDMLLGNDFYTYGAFDLSWVREGCQLSALKMKIGDGYGYPTELIRTVCDLEAIKEVSNIDFNDSFWDNVNYRSNIKVCKVGDQDSFCAITPYVTKLVAGYGDFINTWMVNGNYLSMNADSTNDYLIQNGYESIDSAIARGEYLSDAEVEKLKF